jgi:hypothetical protein
MNADECRIVEDRRISGTWEDTKLNGGSSFEGEKRTAPPLYHAIAGQPLGKSDRRQLAQQSLIQASTCKEIVDWEIFVGSVCAAIRKCESEEERIDVKNILERLEDRQRATLARQSRFPIERCGQRLLRGESKRSAGIHLVWRS